MIFYANGEYVSKGERTAQNGKTYYSIAILQGTEPVSLGCSKEVFEKLDNYDRLDNVTLRFTENVMNGKNGAFISRYCVGIGEAE